MSEYLKPEDISVGDVIEWTKDGVLGIPPKHVLRGNPGPYASFREYFKPGDKVKVTRRDSLTVRISPSPRYLEDQNFYAWRFKKAHAGPTRSCTCSIEALSETGCTCGALNA